AQLAEPGDVAEPLRIDIECCVPTPRAQLAEPGESTWLI
ncbi:MAG: hypothetical protein ACI88C_001692, partial [Acidimicrobiales bacterium]